MENEVSIEQGIEETVRILAEAAGKQKDTKKPVMAAVYGHADSGKNYFLHKVSDELYWKTRQSLTRHVLPISMKHIVDELIEIKKDKYSVFHAFKCRGERKRETTRVGLHQNLDALTHTFTDQPIIISVCLYNPQMDRPPEGDYDLVISNPESTEKVPVAELVKEIVAKNLQMMNSKTQGGMHRCLSLESIACAMGGNAGTWNGYGCQAANFYFNPKTGEIVYFGNPEDVPENIVTCFSEDIFRLAVETSSLKKKIVEYRPPGNTELITRLALEESVRMYNQVFGFDA